MWLIQVILDPGRYEIAQIDPTIPGQSKQVDASQNLSVRSVAVAYPDII